MPTKRKRKKVTSKKIQKGTVGYFFIFGMVAFLIIVGLIAVGGIPNVTFPREGQEVRLRPDTQGSAQNTLQMKTIGFVTIAPTKPPTDYLCKPGVVNTQPGIVIGYAPEPGDSVATNGQIKVWVETPVGAPFIAPNEQVNPSSGAITPGDRGQRAPDGFLWEPALYIAPQTAGAGGTPHFPDLIKGSVNNNPPSIGPGIKGPPIDPEPPSTKKNALNLPNLTWTAEYIWNVSALKLAKGTHQAEFLIHDGERGRAVHCVEITVK